MVASLSQFRSFLAVQYLPIQSPSSSQESCKISSSPFSNLTFSLTHVMASLSIVLPLRACPFHSDFLSISTEAQKSRSGPG